MWMSDVKPNGKHLFTYMKDDNNFPPYLFFPSSIEGAAAVEVCRVNKWR